MNKSHVRACTVTNHIELTKKKGEEAFAVAASDNAADNPLIRVQAAATHQHTDMLCSNEDGAAIVIAKLGMASLTKSQRDKVADTLTKAAMRWRGLRGRHDLYMSASDWFAAEWMPRLREDLAKLADVATPRRFTSDLERSTIFGSCSPQLALTKDGINAQLDAADKLTGEEAPSILRDFEACKMNVGTIGSIPYAIAIEALRRTGSDPTNLSAEQTAAIKAALSDVDPQLLTIALADLKSVCGDSRYGLTRFGYEGRTLLMRPSRVICTAIAACRAAVAVLAQDRAKQLKIHNDQRQRQSFNEPDQFEYRPSCGLQFPWPKPTVP